MSIEDRVHELLTADLFQAFADATVHFGTSDLVLYFDTELTVDPVTAFRRAGMSEDVDCPAELKAKVCRPASEVLDVMKGQPGFWLLVNFGTEMACIAVGARLVPDAPVGDA